VDRRTRSVRPAGPRSGGADRSVPNRLPAVWQILGIAYLVLFCLVFFADTLPNTGVPRPQAWLWFTGLIPELWPPLLQAFLDVVGSPYLSQRLLPLSAAAWVVLVIWATGWLVHRRLGIEAASPAGKATLVFALGATTVSTATLLLGLAGFLNAWLFRGLSAAVVLGAATAALRRRFSREHHKGRTRGFIAKGWSAEGVSAAVVFVILAVLTLLGSCLPATDFDVREYHLQGPKEFFLAGRIVFLPHNVYTNMPFGTEMLSLFSMLIVGDWWWGALAGQCVLACFPLMTVLAVREATLLLFGPVAAHWATLVAASVPWFYRLGIIAYAEGGYCFYTAVTFLVAVLLMRRPSLRTFLLLGVVSGAAFACKYTAAVFVVAPSLVLAVAGSLGFMGGERVDWKATGVTCVGLALTAGPWLGKNLVFTGNPVYPLAYELFGGRNWTTEKDAKWDRGHSAPGYSVRQFLWNLRDVMERSDWQSPLVFGLAPLALLGLKRREAAWGWFVVGYLFLCWWLFTHRIDRFWLPLEPLACVLAGAGAAALASHRAGRATLFSVAMVAVYFNLNLMASPLSGNNAYGSFIDVQARDPLNTATGQFVKLANLRLPETSRILCVGAADLFHINRPVLYNTVFDDVILARYLRKGPPSAAVHAMRKDGITHVFVSWEEVERYRQTYGWDRSVLPPALRPFVRARLFREVWRTDSHVSVVDTVVPRGVLYKLSGTGEASGGRAGHL